MNRISFLAGAAFGFLVAAARLNDYNVIHDMLLLREPDVFLMMASAIGVAAPTLAYMNRKHWRTLDGELNLRRQPVSRKNITGAAVFGAGWAVAGSCPVPALAMTVGGSVLGLFVMAGLFTGIVLRDAVEARSIQPLLRRFRASSETEAAGVQG
ncbi:MAG TPA: DUF6691 family protein [Tepidiformaceae bacterium]